MGGVGSPGWFAQQPSYPPEAGHPPPEGVEKTCPGPIGTPKPPAPCSRAAPVPPVRDERIVHEPAGVRGGGPQGDPPAREHQHPGPGRRPRLRCQLRPRLRPPQVRGDGPVGGTDCPWGGTCVGGS